MAFLSPKQNFQEQLDDRLHSRKGGSQTLRQTFLCLLRIPQAAPAVPIVAGRPKAACGIRKNVQKFWYLPSEICCKMRKNIQRRTFNVQRRNHPRWMLNVECSMFVSWFRLCRVGKGCWGAPFFKRVAPISSDKTVIYPSVPGRIPRRLPPLGPPSPSSARIRAGALFLPMFFEQKAAKGEVPG